MEEAALRSSCSLSGLWGPVHTWLSHAGGIGAQWQWCPQEPLLGRNWRPYTQLLTTQCTWFSDLLSSFFSDIFLNVFSAPGIRVGFHCSQIITWLQAAAPRSHPPSWTTSDEKLLSSKKVYQYRQGSHSSFGGHIPPLPVKSLKDETLRIVSAGEIAVAHEGQLDRTLWMEEVRFLQGNGCVINTPFFNRIFLIAHPNL